MTLNFEKMSVGDSVDSERKILESQFYNPTKVSVAEGGTIDVIDVVPEKLKTEISTFWLPGWGANASVHKENIINLAEHGRRTLTVDAPQGIESTNIQNLTAEQEQEVHAIELRKVAGLLKSMDEKGIEKTDIVGHSEGAIYGVAAALMRPDKFRSLVLVDPAGMMGKDNQGRLLVGAALDGCIQAARMYRKNLSENERDRARSQAQIAAKASQEIFMSHPRQTAQSIGVITSSQIHDMLKTLRDLGIKVSIVHGVDDKLFPMKRIQKQTKKEMVDGFYSVKGSHNELYLRPDKYTELVDSALDSLEALRKKDS